MLGSKMAVTDTTDMTTGSPARLLLAFSMPLMLGNLFQQLYTFVDALIVGQCVSANALAALGATEWLTFIMFGVIQGITQGCSVVIAGFFGEKRIDALKCAIYGGCLIAAVGAAVFTAAGQIAIVPGLRLLRTPAEVFGLTKEYLRILYAGIPITFLYNIAAAILRALGNSKRPLHAMVIASLANIVLDLLFVMGFHMGIAGAAYGTVLAQALAAAYCVIAVRKIEECRIGRESRVIDKSILREQIRLGIPMGLQNIITAARGLVVQATAMASSLIRHRTRALVTVNGFGRD